MGTPRFCRKNPGINETIGHRHVEPVIPGPAGLCSTVFLKLLERLFALFRAKVIGFTVVFIFKGLIFRDVGAAYRVFFHFFQRCPGMEIGLVFLPAFPPGLEKKKTLALPQPFIEEIDKKAQQD
jgi:hypothetical protein